jgi:hypothetical protein
MGDLQSIGVARRHQTHLNRNGYLNVGFTDLFKSRSQVLPFHFPPNEKIPWQCRQLIIGTGTGVLPVMDEVKREAKRRKIALLVLPTTDAIEALQKQPDETNAILHVTCWLPEFRFGVVSPKRARQGLRPLFHM